MADGFVALDSEKLKTSAGVSDLNRMLQKLFELMPGDGETIRIYKGYGSPENSVAAGVGSIYLRLDGGANTSIYIKESGSSNTGWQAK
jgi:hypothetical protein